MVYHAYYDYLAGLLSTIIVTIVTIDFILILIIAICHLQYTYINNWVKCLIFEFLSY